MLPLYHATGVLVLPKSQKSSHVFPTPKGQKERGAAGPPRHALSVLLGWGTHVTTFETWEGPKHLLRGTMAA